MDHITSRKNKLITHIKSLSTDSEYRRKTGEFLCDGRKFLDEAIAFGAEIKFVLWGEKPEAKLSSDIEQYSCPLELLQSVSPLKNSPGPVFSVKIPLKMSNVNVENAIILENVQDPGNVGTVIRTANALGMDVVILVGDCADLYNPKTVRATMGAIFRQKVLEQSIDSLRNYVNQNELKLFGAALSDSAVDIRKVQPSKLAVAIGSEGKGLSKELLNICDGELIIPMEPNSESLNAAVAAAISMWEIYRNR